MDCLDLPSYSTCVRPQGTGATALDIIVESKTMLPKVTVGRSEFLLEEKKHIVYQKGNNKECIIKSFDQLLYEEQYAMEELKVQRAQYNFASCVCLTHDEH